MSGRAPKRTELARAGRVFRFWLLLLVMAGVAEVGLAMLLATTDVLAGVLVGTRLDLLAALLVLLPLRLILVVIAPGWMVFVALRGAAVLVTKRCSGSTAR